MRKRLLRAIQEFRLWRVLESSYGIEDAYYPDWLDIYECFSDVLKNLEVSDADSILLREMIYIIARDNEDEILIDELAEYQNWFEILCQHCVASDEAEAKWQFAAYMDRLKNTHVIKKFIMVLAIDEDEYVCRRAMLNMPAIRPDKVEEYAKLYWDRDWHNRERKDYQRLVVLYALNEIHSPLLSDYLQSAMESGNRVLMEYAMKIQNGMRNKK